MKKISSPSLGFLDTRFVNVTGDTMTGILNIGTKDAATMLRVFTEDGSTSEAIFTPSPTDGFGFIIGSYGMDVVSVDAEGDFSAWDGDLYMNYWSSGDVVLAEGGGDMYLNGGGGDIYLDGAGDVIFVGGRWNSVGNVGIGTDSPGAMLDVAYKATGVTTDNIKIFTARTNVVSFDTTSAALTNYGGYITNTSTRSAGANDLTNIALYLSASGGQNNYALIVDGTIAPETDSASDLGSSDPLYFANAYIDKIYLNATATLDGATAGRVNVTGDLGLAATATLWSGAEIILHRIGTENLFLGLSAGNLAAEGQYNVGVGKWTLTAVDCGDRNIAIGHSALKINTGDYNIAVGSLALDANEGGTENIGIGYLALSTNVSGGYNVAVGNQALATSTGSYNFALGFYALNALTSGHSNIGIGYYASQYNKTGVGNIVIGREAGRGVLNQSHSANVFIGYEVGKVVTTGSDNVAIGVRTGLALTSGNYNVLLGGNAGDNLTTGSSNIIIGRGLDASAVGVSNELNIGGLIYGDLSAGRVGIGLIPTANMLGLSVEAGLLTIKETTAPTADSGYGKIWTDTNNELWFQSGAGVSHLLHGDAFSNIWFHSPNTVEVTISAQDTFTKINSFTVVGKEDDALNVVGSASTNDLTLSASGGGEYEISYHGSVTATGGADKDMMVAFGIILATPKDITDVTDDTISPIVITSTAHGLKEGDMVEIVGVLGNDAANGSFIVDNETANTFEIVALDGTATTGDGDFDAGSPTGDVTIEYPGNMVVHRTVRGADPGAISATGLHILANSDVLALYVANLAGTTNLTVLAVSLDAVRIGD